MLDAAGRSLVKLSDKIDELYGLQSLLRYADPVDGEIVHFTGIPLPSTAHLIPLKIPTQNKNNTAVTVAAVAKKDPKHG